MVLDMDVELQHLISISMDKMTSGAGGPAAGHNNRKSRGMDLRKALLVAHFLQEVRCAYFDEDYEIVANTLSEMRSTESYCEKEEELYKYHDDTYNKDVDMRYTEESRAHLEDSDCKLLSPPSSSSLLSCVTNSEVMVSKLSQSTHPLSVSINTTHVMSCQSAVDLCVDEDVKDDTSNEDNEVPIACEELEVSSCCELATAYHDDDSTTCEAEVISSERSKPSIVNNKKSGTVLEDMPVVITECLTLDCKTSSGQVSTTANQHPVTNTVSSTMCPLPKKKRPIPREYLDVDTWSPPVHKVARSELENKLGLTLSVSSSTFSYATSVAHTVILESRTSTSLSTVCSAIESTSSYVRPNELTGSKFEANPKVVVLMTQSCDPFLPLTCTQLGFEKRLHELSTSSYHTAA